ncbi:hypothetical protein OY671_010495, partial [Metschnikowia pulcherrima]
ASSAAAVLAEPARTTRMNASSERSGGRRRIIVLFPVPSRAWRAEPQAREAAPVSAGHLAPPAAAVFQHAPDGRDFPGEDDRAAAQRTDVSFHFGQPGIADFPFVIQLRAGTRVP